MIIAYPIALALGLLAVALAGMATHKNFIVIMLGVELIFVASTILVITFISYNSSPGSVGVFTLFTIWAVAAAETITLVAFCVVMKARGFDLDVSKLSKLKW